MAFGRLIVGPSAIKWTVASNPCAAERTGSTAVPIYRHKTAIAALACKNGFFCCRLGTTRFCGVFVVSAILGDSVVLYTNLVFFYVAVAITLLALGNLDLGIVLVSVAEATAWQVHLPSGSLHVANPDMQR